MRRTGWVVMALLAGCKDDAPPPAETPAVDVTASALPDNRRLQCEALVQGQVVGRHLAGWTLEAGAALDAPTAPRFCAFRRGDPPGRITIGIDCHRYALQEELDDAKERLAEDGAVELQGLGRAALRTERDGVEQITAWDRDTPCYLLVSWLGDGRQEATELARSVLEALTPASLVESPTAEQ